MKKLTIVFKIFDFYSFEHFDYSGNSLYHYLLCLLQLILF